jgi:P pilus assembly chaperone PapD
MKAKLFSITALFTLMSTSISVSAVSLSSYRVILDQDNRDMTMIVFNQNGEAENCEVWLRDYKYDPVANSMKIMMNGEKVDNSARSFVRMSPKKFTIQPVSQQNIKMRLRRSLNAEEKEYNAMLAVKCQTAATGPQPEQTEQIAITPTLVHNIPVYVRHKALPVSLNFENIVKKPQGKVEFEIHNSSKKTIWGDMRLINLETGQVLAEKKKLAIYPEDKVKSMSFIANSSANRMKLEFVEDNRFSGDYEVESIVE